MELTISWYNAQQEQVLLTVNVDDSSYHYEQIKGDNNLQLKFTTDSYVEIPLGAIVGFQNATYTLCVPPTIKKHSNTNFEVEAVFDSPQSALKKYKMREYRYSNGAWESTTPTLQFNLTATPAEHLKMIIDNLNRREGDNVWSIGTPIIDGTEKLISYDHTYVWDALNNLAETYDTEFEIIGKTIYLKKVEYDKNNPLELSYGKGNGFKSGVGRTNYGDAMPIEVLNVQGTDRNIDYSKYGSKRLLLPKNLSFQYEDGDAYSFDNGTTWKKYNESTNQWVTQSGYTPTNAQSYVTDAYGESVSLAVLKTRQEDSFDGTEIYPSRYGTVTGVSTEQGSGGQTLFNVTDTNIPTDINFGDPSVSPSVAEDCRIAGEEATIVFQSGMLAGREFKYIYEYSTKTFKLVNEEFDGMIMPEPTAFKPVVGDKYAVFGIQLPSSYIENTTYKTGASYDLLRSAVKYLHENKNAKYTFSGELDGIYAKTNWSTLGGKLHIGEYVSFTDANFQSTSVLIRIIGVKQYINNPYSPEIEMSNDSVGATLISEMKKLQAQEVTTEALHEQSIRYARRQFRDAKETSAAIQAMVDELGEDFGNFTKGITPATVQTMQLLVGSENLQFAFGSSPSGSTTFTKQTISATFANDIFTIDLTNGRYLMHYTLGYATDTLKPHSDLTNKLWLMPTTWNTGSLAAYPDTTYYVYAKVNKDYAGTLSTKPTYSGENYTTFVLSETAIAMEGVSGYYHLLVGILNAEVDGDRSFAEMFGYSEILPNRITTDKIMSSDGQGVVIDLVNGTITGNITFNAAQGSDNYNTIQSLINGNSKVNTASTNASNAVSTANNANTNASNALNSINNLEIGGRNFLRNSAEMKVLSSGKAAWRASGGTLTHVTISNKPLNALTGAVRCANNGSTIANIGMAQDYVNDTDRFKFNVGENYIQSYWVRGHLSFYDSVPSNVAASGCTYTYDEASDTYTLTSTTSGDTNVQVWLQNAFREVNYLYLAGKSVTLSVDITTSNNSNKPRLYIYNASTGGNVFVQDLSQGHNEFTFDFPSVASGHTVGLILRMHQYNLGGTVAVGDTCKFANLRIVLADDSQYNYPQPIWQSDSSVPTTDRPSVYLTHDWQRVAWGGELGGTQADTYSAGYTYCLNMPVGGWFEVCAMKLEKGTKATDWTPAPEDVEAEILAEKTRLDNIDSDSVFSIAEKQVFRNEWFTISGIADTSIAGATIVANSAYINGSLYQSYNSCPHATTLRTELLNAFNNLRTYLNTCGLYTNSDYTSFNKATLQNYLATYYTAELNLQKYKENVGNLVATCSTAAGTSPKVIICPELTADMLVDPDMRMKIKFTNANSLDQFTMRFQNSSGGSPIVSTGMISANYRVYIRFNDAYMNYTSRSPLLYWVAGMEIEWKYYGTFIAYGNQNPSVVFQMVDEANYKTIMTYSKAIQGSTSIIGGLILTQMIQAGAGTQQAGMNGTSTSNVAFWAGGSVGNADNFNVPVVIKRDGNAKMGLLMIGNDGKLYFKDSGSERFLITNNNVALNSSAKIYNTGNENGNDSYETFGTAIASGTSVTTTRTNYVIKSISNIPNASSGVKYNNVTIKVHAEMGMVASTAGTGGYATIGLEIYDGSSWIQVTSFTKAFRAGETGEWAYPTSNDYTFIYNSATLSSNKAVIGLRAFAYCDSAAGSVTCAITNVKWCYYQDLTKSKTIIGKNGLGVMLNSTNLFQCTHTNDSVLTTTIKGNTDIPGVLWAGKVSANGSTTTTTTNSNAGRSVSCVKQSTGYYKLTLTNFSSIPTPIATIILAASTTGSGWTVNIVSCSQTEIYLYTRQDNSNADSAFYLALFGTN